MPLPATGGGRIMFSGRPSVRKQFLVSHGISSLSEGTSIKLHTNVHHVSGHC